MSLVSIQLSIRLKVPLGHEPTKKLLDEAVGRWAVTGKAPKGMAISITDYRHVGRKRTKVTDQEEARERFRGLLLAGSFNAKVRSA